MVVTRADGGEYAIAAGSLEPVTEAEESLLHATLLAGALGIVVTAIGAWFATRRGLRPLESITALANEVASDAMELRTGLDDEDEIGAVAAAIDRMLSRLQHAFDSQKRFLEDVSHELRTPLTIARGHLELVAEAPDATALERSEAVSVAIEEIDRVARLVDGLLELARASDVQRLHIGTVAVRPLLEAVAAQMSRLQERDWRVDVPDGTQAAGDEAAIRQIILNLARNADEHSPAEAPIDLTATARDGHVQILVADRGTGVDPNIAGTAFERFTHDGNGIGLGLSISQALAEAQHGRVSLEPRDGGGTVATLELPRA
jgi:two-component system, OmpR family, sensor kinase